MSNGMIKPTTTKGYLMKIDQKLDDFLTNHEAEHKIMWKLLIGLPSLLVVLFALIQVFGGK